MCVTSASIFWVYDHKTHNYIQWRPSTITTAYTRQSRKKITRSNRRNRITKQNSTNKKKIKYNETGQWREKWREKERSTKNYLNTLFFVYCCNNDLVKKKIFFLFYDACSFCRYVIHLNYILIAEILVVLSIRKEISHSTWTPQNANQNFIAAISWCFSVVYSRSLSIITLVINSFKK